MESVVAFLLEAERAKTPSNYAKAIDVTLLRRDTAGFHPRLLFEGALRGLFLRLQLKAPLLSSRQGVA